MSLSQQDDSGTYVNPVEVDSAVGDCSTSKNSTVDGQEARKPSPELKSGAVINIRQIASVLLSDTSESDAETSGGNCEEFNVSVGKEQLLEGLYDAIETQVREVKSGECSSPFMKSWIAQQERLCSSWKRRRKSADCEAPAETVDSEEFQTVTELNIKPQFSKQQIEERMAEMDPEKRDRWEKWFVEFELKKYAARKGFRGRKIRSSRHRAGGQPDVVGHYRTELENLTQGIGSIVQKLERTMGELEAKEQSKAEDRVVMEEASGVDKEDVETTTSRSQSEGTSSASEGESSSEGRPSDWVDRTKLLVPPNLSRIKELLQTKVVFPDSDDVSVHLGESLADSEKKLLESHGLDSYVTRVAYFFTYRRGVTSDFLKTEYNEIVQHVRPAIESDNTRNYGCLLIYENVNMAIAMVEGSEFEVLKHLTALKTSPALAEVVRGKVLYVHRLLLKRYFNKWVVRVESPPEGKIKYLTKSRKIVYRTAAARVVRTSEQLHKVFRHLSKEERYLIDPRSLYVKAKYLILLPQPATFAYLLKYDVLRDLVSYLDELGRAYDLETDEEQLLAFAEDVRFSYYVDTDDEDVSTDKLNCAKAIVADKERAAKIKTLDDLTIKETDERISWERFQIDETPPTIIDSRVKLSENWEHPAVRLSAAIESLQSGDSKPPPNSSRTDDNGENGSGFLVFVEKGSSRWTRAMSRVGVAGSRGPDTRRTRSSRVEVASSSGSEAPTPADNKCAFGSKNSDSDEYDDKLSEESSSGTSW